MQPEGFPHACFYTDGPITEAELKVMEQRAKGYNRQGSYIPAKMVQRLILDNRRLRNLLLDMMEPDPSE